MTPPSTPSVKSFRTFAWYSRRERFGQRRTAGKPSAPANWNRTGKARLSWSSKRRSCICEGLIILVCSNRGNRLPSFVDRRDSLFVQCLFGFLLCLFPLLLNIWQWLMLILLPLLLEIISCFCLCCRLGVLRRRVGLLHRAANQARLGTIAIRVQNIWHVFQNGSRSWPLSESVGSDANDWVRSITILPRIHVRFRKKA